MVSLMLHGEPEGLPVIESTRVSRASSRTRRGEKVERDEVPTDDVRNSHRRVRIATAAF